MIQTTMLVIKTLTVVLESLVLFVKYRVRKSAKRNPSSEVSLYAATYCITVKNMKQIVKSAKFKIALEPSSRIMHFF